MMREMADSSADSHQTQFIIIFMLMVAKKKKKTFSLSVSGLVVAHL